MISLADLDQQLKELNVKIGVWGRSELRELAEVLTPNEKISQVVNGYYENGFALLASTDHRMLLIDKKPFNFLNVEDFRFDMINQLDYNHRLFNSSINVSAGPKNLQFTSYNQKGLRELLNCVQCRMIEIKEDNKKASEQQFGKLDKLEKALRQYLETQLKSANQSNNNGTLADDSEDTDGLAFNNYLEQMNGHMADDRYIRTGSLLPKPDLTAARIAFAKLPMMISRRRH